MASLLLQASLSYYQAQHAQHIAQLDLYLNHSNGADNITQKINELFRELAIAELAMNAIQRIINDNVNKTLLSEQLATTSDAIKKMKKL